MDSSNCIIISFVFSSNLSGLFGSSELILELNSPAIASGPVIPAPVIPTPVKPKTAVEQDPAQDTAEVATPGAKDAIEPVLSLAEAIEPELIDCFAKPVSFQGATPTYPDCVP